ELERALGGERLEPTALAPVDRAQQLQAVAGELRDCAHERLDVLVRHERAHVDKRALALAGRGGDRKSTRLNSSHVKNSYAVFCAERRAPRPSPPRRSSDLRTRASPRGRAPRAYCARAGRSRSAVAGGSRGAARLRARAPRRSCTA